MTPQLLEARLAAIEANHKLLAESVKELAEYIIKTQDRLSQLMTYLERNLVIEKKDRRVN